MKIKDLARVDLPREKLAKYGPEKLADHELLAILLGSGIQGTNVLELSRKILKLIKKIGYKKVTLDDLISVKGLGAAKAGQVVAVLELGRRMNSEDRKEILSPEDIWNMCADIRDSKREHFLAFYFDTQQRLLERHIVSIGTLNASLVHPREVFEPALSLHAATLIIAHNHPSGDLEPSPEDKEITRTLKQAGEILGIEVADHVIVAHSGYVSFQQLGLV